MRKTAVTTVSTVAGVVLLLSLKPHQSPAATAAQPSPASPSSTGSVSPSSSTTHAPGGTSGTFTGSVITTSYGPVQVAVTLSHGKIIEVKALQMPSDRPRSQQIAAESVPQLTREALSAQSAHI